MNLRLFSSQDLIEALHSPPGWLAIDADALIIRVGWKSPVLLPGSFNPVHEGHWRLAAAAEALLDRPVLFELSVENVDKPALAADEVQRRLAPFAGKATVVLTRAPLFTQKAELFPRATFVVGADTAVRLVAPHYYYSDADRMIEALERIRGFGCRFLVAARSDADGRLVSLNDIAVPRPFRDLFSAIDVRDFQIDISSTVLRSRSPR